MSDNPKPVRPGSFCVIGATGTSATGVPMLCTSTKPGERGRMRRHPDAPAPTRSRGAKPAVAPSPPVTPTPVPVPAGEDPARAAYARILTAQGKRPHGHPVTLLQMREEMAAAGLDRDQQDAALHAAVNAGADLVSMDEHTPEEEAAGFFDGGERHCMIQLSVADREPLNRVRADGVGNASDDDLATAQETPGVTRREYEAIRQEARRRETAPVATALRNAGDWYEAATVLADHRDYYRLQAVAEHLGVDPSGFEEELYQRLLLTAGPAPAGTTTWLDDDDEPSAPVKRQAAPIPAQTTGTPAPVERVATTPAEATALLPVSGAMNPKPLTRNVWGTFNNTAPVCYHDHSFIGEAVKKMGADKHLDVDGEPLADQVGIIATDATMGRVSAQEALTRLRTLASRLPAGSRARTLLEDAVDTMDTPPMPVPDVPEDTPAPLRRLLEDLVANPLARQDPHMEIEKVVSAIHDLREGRRTLRETADYLRARVQNQHHEGQHGKFEIDAMITRARVALRSRAVPTPTG